MKSVIYLIFSNVFYSKNYIEMISLSSEDICIFFDRLPLMFLQFTIGFKTFKIN